MAIPTRPVRVWAVLLGTTLHRDLPAARSARQVSMTLTLILQLHAWVAQPASTQQRGRHPVLTVQLATQMLTVMHRPLARCVVQVDMLQRGARGVPRASQDGSHLQRRHYVSIVLQDEPTTMLTHLLRA